MFSIPVVILVPSVFVQDAPIHATMVTLVVVSVDRYRRIVYPHKARLPPFIAVLGVWITSVCVVLPYAIYMNYIDLQVRRGQSVARDLGP